MSKAVPIHKLAQLDAPLRDSAPVVLVRLGELIEFSDAVQDPTNITELHDMRIAAKRLRYTLELFAPTLDPKRVKRLLKTAETIQERIGAIHDCDMLIPQLEETLGREEKRERKQALKKHAGPPEYFAAEGLVPLIAQKRSERDRLYLEFIAYWNALPPETFARSLAALISTSSPADDTPEGDKPDAHASETSPNANE